MGKKTASFIASFDLFGGAPGFTILGKGSYTTLIGGIVSFLILGLIVLIFTVELIDYQVP